MNFGGDKTRQHLHHVLGFAVVLVAASHLHPAILHSQEINLRVSLREAVGSDSSLNEAIRTKNLLEMIQKNA